MTVTIFASGGGEVVVPDRALVLVDRADGGNLVVNPPRPVWERSELTAEELTRWSTLVAAAGRAMLDVLPALEGGCINYWEAGNWALNEAAEPRGPKRGDVHRRVHLHLLGRSRTAADPAYRWGEAPMFPTFAERHTWAASHARLTPDECVRVADRIELLLGTKYAVPEADVRSRTRCAGCGYPTTRGVRCEECAG